ATCAGPPFAQANPSAQVPHPRRPPIRAGSRIGAGTHIRAVTGAALGAESYTTDYHRPA
ncbi:unnamed protein product, partial [Closterium sp. Yama58-4]